MGGSSESMSISPKSIDYLIFVPNLASGKQTLGLKPEHLGWRESKSGFGPGLENGPMESIEFYTRWFSGSELK